MVHQFSVGPETETWSSSGVAFYDPCTWTSSWTGGNRMTAWLSAFVAAKKETIPGTVTIGMFYPRLSKNSVMRCSLPRQHNRRRNITNSKCNVLIFKEQLVYSTSTLTIPSSRPKTVLTSEPSRMSERGSGNKDMSMCVTMWLYLSQGLEILPNKKQKKNDDFMKSNLKSLVDELFIK